MPHADTAKDLVIDCRKPPLRTDLILFEDLPLEVPPAWYRAAEEPMILRWIGVTSGALFSNRKCQLRVERSHPSGLFIVESYIRHALQEEMSRCTRVINRDHLRDMFALPIPRNRQDREVTEFLRRFDLTAGLPGYFARRGNFVSFPGIGTGTDADPNLCILVTPEMQEMIAVVAA